MLQIEKEHRRSTLMSDRKKDLVDRIIYLEHNNNALNRRLDIQAANFKKLKKWILIEDQMPDQPGDYWVTIRHLDGTFSTEKYFWKPGWPCEDAWKEVVVAWQPYYCPEPFKPDN